MSDILSSVSFITKDVLWYAILQEHVYYDVNDLTVLSCPFLIFRDKNILFQSGNSTVFLETSFWNFIYITLLQFIALQTLVFCALAINLQANLFGI